MHRLCPAIALLLSACAKYEPPPPPEPQEETTVDASIGHTWDAVVDLFALRNIPIRTIERASGIIATEALRVDPQDGAMWADCGGISGGVRYRPNSAIYNVLVRGDSTRSTVRATVRWSYIHEDENQTCTSNYTWESDLERDVRSRAEEADRSAAAWQKETPPVQVEPRVPADRTAATTSRPVAPQISHSPARQAPPKVRTNAELLQSPSFRQALKDVQRLRIVSAYQELKPDTLTVQLDEGAFMSASTEHNLGQLFMAYRGTSDYGLESAMELMHQGRRVGLYSTSGLTWEAVR